MLIPQHMGKYKIIRLLDQGAVALLYEGLDPSQQRRVALKIVRPSLLTPHNLARLRREAQVSCTFSHPNIVAGYEYNEVQETPFLVLALIHGRKLREPMDRSRRFELSWVVEILSQTLEAMAYIHDRGVIHLDLKPANMILSESSQIKVTDFGLARFTELAETQTGIITGTPHYMSPEQFMGRRLDKRSDLFSLGVILYELLTNKRPFPGEKIQTVQWHVLNTLPKKPSTLNPSCPKAWDVVIQKALAKRPVNRFQDAESFQKAIKKALKFS